MKSLVVYYSFTGNTRKVAGRLAEALGADLAEVTCRAYSFGLWGALRQAYDVFTGGAPPIERPASMAERYDVTVALGPVWAARPAPPLRSLVRRFAPTDGRLAVMLTCDGTSEKYPGERALEELVQIAPVRPIRTHLFKRADLEGPHLDTIVATLADEIRSEVEQRAPLAG